MATVFGVGKMPSVYLFFIEFLILCTIVDGSMRLSSYSDYALRVLMQAALTSPERTTIHEVASAFNISRNHLSKVVHALASNDFLHTHRGVGGGFTLARPASQISVGDIVRLTEGDESVIDCLSRGTNPCAIFPSCKLKGVLFEAGRAFFEVLDRHSLQDLVHRKTEMKELLGI